MKANIRSLVLAMAGLIAAAGILTSCEDRPISYTLEGTWGGNMYQEYIWDGTVYEPSYTEVTFLRDPYSYSSGDGYWVDYFDSWIPWNNKTITNHITWTVSAGRIYLRLVEDDIEFIISDYRLCDDHFKGELIGLDGSIGKFNLYYVSSPYIYTRSAEEVEATKIPEIRPERVRK